MSGGGSISMSIDWEKLTQATYVRQSRRKFLDRPLDRKDREALEMFAADIEREVPFQHEAHTLIRAVPEGLRPVSFVGASSFAAFTAPQTLLGEAHVGFLGEILVLKATDLGLGTCWVAQFRRLDTYQAVFGSTEEGAPRTIHAVTPLGYVTEKVSGVSDRITTTIFSGRKKPVEKNLSQDSLVEFPENVRWVLELASKAPSALNAQPWTFRVTDTWDRFVIEIAKPEGYQHKAWGHSDIDVGICAAHVWLGLMSRKVEHELELVDSPGRVVWTFKL